MGLDTWLMSRHTGGRGFRVRLRKPQMLGGKPKEVRKACKKKGGVKFVSLDTAVSFYTSGGDSGKRQPSISLNNY